MEARTGRLFVVTGPSGAGKTTLINGITTRRLELSRALTVTTRPPRKGERDGVDYRFWSEERFTRGLKELEFVEWVSFGEFRYGLRIADLEWILSSGDAAIVVVETQGARALAQRGTEVVTIFVAPPSLDELEQRLRARGTETDIEIERRLAKAAAQMGERAEFDYLLINDDEAKALDRLSTMVRVEMRHPPLRTAPLGQAVHEILDASAASASPQESGVPRGAILGALETNRLTLKEDVPLDAVDFSWSLSPIWTRLLGVRRFVRLRPAAGGGWALVATVGNARNDAPG